MQLTAAQSTYARLQDAAKTPGAVAGNDIVQVSRLGLAVAVPEAEVSGLSKGAKVEFSVPAYPQRTL